MTHHSLAGFFEAIADSLQEPIIVVEAGSNGTDDDLRAAFPNLDEDALVAIEKDRIAIITPEFESLADGKFIELAHDLRASGDAPVWAKLSLYRYDKRPIVWERNANSDVQPVLIDLEVTLAPYEA